MVVGVVITILTLIEPSISPALVITLLGFLATIVISLFGLLRTEQQESKTKSMVRETILELFKDFGEVEGVSIEAGSPEGLRDGINTLIEKASENATRSRHRHS